MVEARVLTFASSQILRATAWLTRENDSTRIRDMIDGTSNTLMVVAAETKIPWTKPADCPLSEISEFGLLKGESLQVLMGDGSVREFRKPSEEEIRKQALINDRSW